MAYIILGAWAWVYVHFETMNGALNQWLGLDFFYGELLEANRKTLVSPNKIDRLFPSFSPNPIRRLSFP